MIVTSVQIKTAKTQNISIVLSSHKKHRSSVRITVFFCSISIVGGESEKFEYMIFISG